MEFERLALQKDRFSARMKEIREEKMARKQAEIDRLRKQIEDAE